MALFEDEHSVEENTFSVDAGCLVRAILEDVLDGEKLTIM